MRMPIRLFAVLMCVAGFAQADVTLVHVHGLSYSADGKRLMIPVHFGLAIYENGKWKKAAGPEHDYMGFSGTARHIYSSGHPAPGSGLVNPFGLLRSSDGGKTWDKLGLEGESDFHLMAAGWNSNAVYVWNGEPNSRMRASGLYYTVNDGFAWRRVGANGLAGDLRAIAVHPDEAAIVALATSQGLYLSRDHGERFVRLGTGASFAPFFDLDGTFLWYATLGNSGLRLARLPLDKGQREEFRLPPLQEDAVAFMAQNPTEKSEYAIATFQRNVYVTNDGARSWKQIARRGQTSLE
ncbi:MAG: F510_1955 family glycosylhydrolase [Burkholderiales bacterium]